MGEICGGFGTGHILMSRGTAGDGGERAYQGMRELGRRVAALRPDAVVLISSDHFYNFRGDEPHGFLIGLDETYLNFGDMDIPVRTVKNHVKLARSIEAAAERSDFALAPLPKTYRPDHGVMLPYLMIGDPTIPFVPIITNLGLDRVPTLAQGWKLGQVVREAVTASASLRVVVIGAGGLSHWLGVPEMGRTNAKWDHEVMEAITSGKADSLISWTQEEIVANGGNGGLEIVNWIAMAASLQGAKGERVYYEELPQWMTGLGGIELKAWTGVER